MKRITAGKIPLILVLSSILIFFGCQSEGGELLPIGGDGITFASSRFENDTAIINDNNLKLKLYGSWDGRAKIRIVIENNTAETIRFDFKQSKILDSKGETRAIDSAYEDKGASIEQIKDNQFSAAPNSRHKLIIGFPLNLMSSISDEPPRIISVVLKAETNSKMKESRDYKIDFKGIMKKEGSGKADPKDW